MEIYVRAGEGPPVVLIAQLGTGGKSWQPVIDRLPGLGVVTYDRPGTGGAAPRPAPNLPLPHSGFAHELAALLDRHDIVEPAVVVGHSFGSLIARAFAAIRPKQVAGIVHVDGSIPQFHLMPTSEPKLDGDGPDATEVDVVAGQVGILSAAPPPVPTVVMTRTHGRWDGASDPPHPAVEDLWLTSQRILARETRSPLIVADDSGHQLPRDAPDLVAYAINMVHAAAQTGSPVEIDEGWLFSLSGHLDGYLR